MLKTENKSIKYGIRFKYFDYKRLQDAAKDKKMTKSTLIRQALYEYYNNHKLYRTYPEELIEDDDELPEILNQIYGENWWWEGE